MRLPSGSIWLRGFLLAYGSDQMLWTVSVDRGGSCTGWPSAPDVVRLGVDDAHSPDVPVGDFGRRIAS
jgi:hypothetical protein